MCLTLFAWRVHQDYTLILCANRDEFHHRPTRPLQRWSNGIVGGRDEEHGGTWLGLRASRLAWITNVRDPDLDGLGTSRGAIPVDFLLSSENAALFAQHFSSGPKARPFNGVLLDGKELWFLRSAQETQYWRIPSGIHGLSNGRLNEPWPKVKRGRSQLADALSSHAVAIDALFEMLRDRQMAEDETLPNTGIPLDWERKLSAAFIVTPSYGTRSSTIVMLHRDGSFEVQERRFDARGEESGRTLITG